MGVSRINVTLPESLLARLRQRVPTGKMSRYIAEATAERLAEDERAELRALLKEQYTERSKLDLELAQEFAHAEEEVES